MIGSGPTSWWSRAAIVLGMAMVALAGCSGGATTPPSPVATTTVDLPKSYKFVPASIVVDVGAAVTWTNNDNFTHNVTFAGEPSKTMKPGESVTREFPSGGTFPYQCTLHPQNMQGTVIVGGG